jgi:hypothetical protein
MSINKIIHYKYSSTYFLNSKYVEMIVCYGRKFYSEYPEREYVFNKLESLLLNHGIFWYKQFEVEPNEEDKKQAKKLFPELY